MWQKIQALKLHKNNKIRLLLAIELAALIFLIAGLFGRNQIYSFPMEGGVGEVTNIAIPRGTYQVRLYYHTDGDGVDLCTLSDTTIGFRHLFTNGEVLYSGKEHTDFEMWLLRDTTGMQLSLSRNAANLETTKVEFVKNNGLQRIMLFTMVIFVLILNGIVVYRAYDEKYEISVSQKTEIFGVMVITLLSSLPLFTDYILSSGDVGYHLMRIEGLKDGLLAGQFPVRIAPRWLQDYGYGDALFYGQTLLLPAALLRMIGFTVTTSYQWFLVLVNFVTAVISFISFKRIFQDGKIGILCSMLYTLSIYRLYKLYLRGSVGEALGFMFLPLLAYGFYRVFTLSTKDKKYRRSMIPLVIGFTGILQTHLLTGEIAGGFTILLCLIMWKKVFRPRTFVLLAKTVLYSILLTVWFLVPFFDMMMNGDFMIQHAYERTIQERGLYVAQLFSPIPFVGGNVFFQEGGMRDAIPVGIGFALMVALFLWGYLLFLGKRYMKEKTALKKEEIALGKICFGFALLSMGMSLMIFPWNSIQFLHRIFSTLVSSLQFPERVLMIASLCSVVVAGALGKLFLRSGNPLPGVVYTLGMVFLTVLTSMFLLGNCLFKEGFVRIYNAEGMGFGYIAGEEYLPYGTDAALLKYAPPMPSEDLYIQDVEKKPLCYELFVQNETGTVGEVTLPLLFYKGYETLSLDNGQRLTTYPGENGKVTVEIPVDYQGRIRTSYVPPLLWRLAEVVSFGAFVLLCTGLMLSKRQQGKIEKGKTIVR